MSELKMKTMRDPVLEKARQTYGNKNQILVCIEELNELACVLVKYSRYEDKNKAREELYDSVLDEVADVNIILNHVQHIFRIDDNEVADRVEKKILVCIEKLNELACVLAKYPRYDSEEIATLELRDAVLDEVADVNIILNHVEALFDFSEEEIEYRIQQKRERLKRWLDASDSMQRTIDDREIACYKESNTDNEINCSNCKQTDYSLCKTCFSSEAGEGIRPFFK